MSSRTAERADHGTAARPGGRGIDPWRLAAVPVVALTALVLAMLWTGSGAARLAADPAEPLELSHSMGQPAARGEAPVGQLAHPHPAFRLLGEGDQDLVVGVRDAGGVGQLAVEPVGAAREVLDDVADLLADEQVVDRETASPRFSHPPGRSRGAPRACGAG